MDALRRSACDFQCKTSDSSPRPQLTNAFGIAFRAITALIMIIAFIMVMMIICMKARQAIFESMNLGLPDCEEGGAAGCHGEFEEGVSEKESWKFTPARAL